MKKPWEKVDRIKQILEDIASDFDAEECEQMKLSRDLKFFIEENEKLQKYNEELKKQNDLLRSDLLFLCQPLSDQVNLDDLEECFKMLRRKWNLPENTDNSKEGV